MKVSDFTLLLVEDDPNDLLLMQRAFARAALVNPIRIVRDGEEAIDYLSGAREFADRGRYPLPSLVLMDLKLPKKSGLDVLQWMREQPALKSTPVIVLTSSRESADVRQAYELGANSFLVKPMGFDNLLEVIHALKMYWVILNKAPDDPAPHA